MSLSSVQLAQFFQFRALFLPIQSRSLHNSFSTRIIKTKQLDKPNNRRLKYGKYPLPSTNTHSHARESEKNKSIVLAQCGGTGWRAHSGEGEPLSRHASPCCFDSRPNKLLPIMCVDSFRLILHLCRTENYRFRFVADCPGGGSRKKRARGRRDTKTIGMRPGKPHSSSPICHFTKTVLWR